MTCGLYYKHVTIVNDASSGVSKLKASLNDAARGVIYDRHVFIIQATDHQTLDLAGKACQGEALLIVVKICKLWL